jgi:hypothetical protein
MVIPGIHCGKQKLSMHRLKVPSCILFLLEVRFEQYARREYVCVETDDKHLDRESILKKIIIPVAKHPQKMVYPYRRTFWNSSHAVMSERNRRQGYWERQHGQFVNFPKETLESIKRFTAWVCVRYWRKNWSESNEHLSNTLQNPLAVSCCPYVHLMQLQSMLCSKCNYISNCFIPSYRGECSIIYSCYQTFEWNFSLPVEPCVFRQFYLQMSPGMTIILYLLFSTCGLLSVTQ